MRPELRAHALLAVGVAGAVGGIAQALPFGAALSCCCTPWSLLGSVAAVLYVVRQSGLQVLPAEGAVMGLGVGAITGTVGGVLGAIREMLSLDRGGMLGTFLRDRHDVMGLGVAQFLWAALVLLLVHLLFGLALGPLGGWLASLAIKPPPPVR